MSRSVLLLAVISLLLLSCNYRPVDTMDPLSVSIKPEAAKEDFDLFTRILKKAHPGLTDYISDQRKDILFDSVFKTIGEKITLRDFYDKLAYVVDEIGCSHTFTSLPQYVIDTIYNREIFFPYPLAFIEGDLVVNSTLADLPEGTKILIINKVTVDDVMTRLRKHNTVDGAHRETQRYMAAGNFSLEYFTELGGFPEFELQIEDTSGKVRTVFTKAVSLEHINTRQQQLYYFDATDVTYSMRLNEENGSAVFRLTRFDFDSRNQEMAFEMFLENSFELLRLKKNIRHLIIDLRENRGGDLYYCFLLYSYLCEKPFSEYNSVFSRIKSVPFRESLSSIESTDIGNINLSLKEEFTSHDKYGYLKPDSLIKKWEPQERRFAGNVFIITNANVASAASYFTSLVKSSGRGKVVGVETCGSEHSINGLSLLRYRLPATGIGIEFPYAKLVYSQQGAKSDRGIIPDHIIPDTYESFRNNEDRQVKFIIDSLISKKR